MNRIFFIAALTLIVTGNAYGQVQQRMTAPVDTLTMAGIGVRLGADANGITGKTSFKDGVTIGGTAGAFAYVERKKIGLRVEGFLHYYTWRLQDTFVSGGKFHNFSIDVPVLFAVNPVPHIWILVGPQFSTLLAVTHDPSTSNDPKTFFQANNISGIIGIEGRLTKELLIGVRYAYGFSNINDAGTTLSTEKWNTTSIQAYIGYNIH